MDSSPPTYNEAQILLVEDNPGDVRLVEETFEAGHIINQLHVVTDGQEALDFIHRRGEYEDAPRPDAILLDLKLPRVDGEDVLHEIKHHPPTENVPVVIVTGMDEDYIKSRDLDDDVDEDGVIEKPIDPDEFLKVIRGFNNISVSVVSANDD